VAEKLLVGPDVVAAFDEMGRERVAMVVATRAFGDVGLEDEGVVSASWREDLAQFSDRGSQDLPEKEEEGGECLVLRGGADLPVDVEMGKYGVEIFSPRDSRVRSKACRISLKNQRNWCRVNRKG
jgi:hypothetical protein